MTDNALIDSLLSIVGDDRTIPTVRLPLYEVDGLTPQVAVCPNTVEQVASVLAASAQSGAGVITWGGGTSIATGNTPSRYEVALDVTRLNQVVAYEPDDLTIVVQAGMRLQELQEHLGRSGQYLPFDPPSPASATIGGILAANAGGPGRHAYGWPRDWTLGMQVALADGTLARSGGRVVKNVAGYDMGKLYIGSFGTLGVIVEAAFKVVPLPEACATLIASFDSPSRAAEAALAVHKRNLAVESLAVASPSALEDTSNWTLLVASAGGAAAVERTLQEAASICRDQDAAEGQRLFDDRASTAWEAARQLMLPSRDNGSLLTRAGLIPSQVGAFLEQQTSLSSKRGLTAASLAYPAVGSVYGVWDGEGLTDGGTDLVSSLRTAATVNAPVVLMACPISLKQEIDVWGDGRSDLPLMRRIKQQLDPRSTMSPGRFLGRM